MNDDGFETCGVWKIDGRFKECGNINIVLAVMWKGRCVWLCKQHWEKVAMSDGEWSGG